MSRQDRRRPPIRRPEVGQDASQRAGVPVRTRSDRPAPVAGSDRRLLQALLPLRFFVGATFLYAGVDKLIDPHFLSASGPGSIAEQLTGFTRVSPIAGLVQVFALPFPVLVGLAIALVEIAIGLGALTGLLYRTSAAAGTALSLLFFLTASWSTRPYYYGPDLPYAAGWLTLALAGHGGLAILRLPFASDVARSRGPGEASLDRRTVLQAGVLGAAAVAVASIAGLGKLVRVRDDVATVPTASPGAPAAPAVSALPGVSAGPSSAPAAGQIATLSALKPGTAVAFVDPASGDPATLIRLASGNVVAFDAVCTHQGCTVEYDQPSGLLFCPCHGAVFDPTHNAQVLQGPAPIPLTPLPIVVDKATGAITLHG